MGHETHLSAEPSRAQAPPRISCAHGNQGRPQSARAPSRARPQEAVGLTISASSSSTCPPVALVVDRLRKRADFLRAARGLRSITPGATLEVAPTPATYFRVGSIRVGFTATKKLGNAVVRNRTRRRLRAAAAAVLPLYGHEGNDYVLVARRETLDRPFDRLIGDLISALQSAHSRLGRSKAGESL